MVQRLLGRVHFVLSILTLKEKSIPKILQLIWICLILGGWVALALILFVLASFRAQARLIPQECSKYFQAL